ncbi:MAG TPA: hypothetical protein PLS90_15300 [Candidatus Sumerlaeota bacterium]|nr:hypothetical protein [Candidatus Sumerlaeota bacterium]HPK03813.1 hypothetical protein [Candidatus Sumerlaeota bacterium]
MPVVTRRITENTVWIEDGGTAIIAGLTDTRNRKGAERVPYLHRIPILGRLFRADIWSDTERQVGVFITAHLMQEGPSTETVTPNTFWNKTTMGDYAPADEAFVAEMQAALERYTGRSVQ